MKKKLNLFVAMALVFVMTFAFVGCSSIDPQGTWIAKSAEIHYEMQGIVMDIDMDYQELGMTMQINLKNDGTFVQIIDVPEMPDFGLGVIPGMTIPGEEEFEPIYETITGTWSFDEDDNEIKLVADTTEYGNTTFFKVEGDNLVLEQKMNLGSISFHSIAVYERD